MQVPTFADRQAKPATVLHLSSVKRYKFIYSSSQNLTYVQETKWLKAGQACSSSSAQSPLIAFLPGAIRQVMLVPYRAISVSNHRRIASSTTQSYS
jgi:hypothetical protein